MPFHESGRGVDGQGGGVRGGVLPQRRKGDVGSELVAKESKRFPDMPTLPALVSCVSVSFWEKRKPPTQAFLPQRLSHVSLVVKSTTMPCTYPTPGAHRAGDACDTGVRKLGYIHVHVRG